MPRQSEQQMPVALHAGSTCTEEEGHCPLGAGTLPVQEQHLEKEPRRSSEEATSGLTGIQDCTGTQHSKARPETPRAPSVHPETPPHTPKTFGSVTPGSDLCSSGASHRTEHCGRDSQKTELGLQEPSPPSASPASPWAPALCLHRSTRDRTGAWPPPAEGPSHRKQLREATAGQPGP